LHTEYLHLIAGIIKIDAREIARDGNHVGTRRRERDRHVAGLAGQGARHRGVGYRHPLDIVVITAADSRYRKDRKSTHLNSSHVSFPPRRSSDRSTLISFTLSPVSLK